MASYDYFEIDMIKALAGQLVDVFDTLDPGELGGVEFTKMDRGQGVYQLILDSKIVYMGKASNRPKKLEDHRIKISGRHNIEVDQVYFKCLYIHPNWTALAPEETLNPRCFASGQWGLTQGTVFAILMPPSRA